MPGNFSIELEDLKEKLQEIESEFSSLNGRVALLQEQISQSEEKLIDLSHKKDIYSKSVELLTIIQQLTRDNIKTGFENLVTYALRYIFQEDYRFELNFDRRGNYQEVNFNPMPPGRTEPSDPLDSLGGGTLDVVSVALRIALIELSKPKIDGFLAFDEAGKHISVEYIAKFGKFLKEINRKIKRQIICVTHQKILAEEGDNIIDLNKKEGIND